jgi:hypothetical protein
VLGASTYPPEKKYAICFTNICISCKKENLDEINLILEKTNERTTSNKNGIDKANKST